MYITRIVEEILKNKRGNGKVLVILGARQVGKTTLINHVFEKERVERLNLDVEVEKQRFLAVSKLDPEEAVKLLGDPEFIIIDEAQRLPETGRIVKGWFDSKISPQIILLGSSSLNLLNHSAESLTGRNEKIFLPPLVFEEIIRAQKFLRGEYNSTVLLENFSEQIDVVLDQTVVYGGYPNAITQTNKKEFLNNLVSDYLLKDVFQSSIIKDPDNIRKLLALIAHQTGSLASVNELSNTLDISRITVLKYLALLESMYVIFRLPAYSTNPRKEISKSEKIFFWDTGVRNALIGDFTPATIRSDIGALWENWVVAEFAKHNLLNGGLKKLFYWRSRSGGEVDLIVKDDEKISAFEIKWRAFGKPARIPLFKNYNVKVEIINQQNPFIGDRIIARGDRGEVPIYK